jgi:alpha-ribazole phosphatase/probable phosphoglycerate mutase
MTSQEFTTIDLLRHGEVTGGACYRGSKNDPLSPLGWQQLYEAIGDYNIWNEIITSPLIRCKEFAEQLSQRRKLPLTVYDQLREIHFGQWEGRTVQELLANEPKKVAHYWRDPLNNTPPDGESLADFHKRIMAVWNKLLCNHWRQHLLIVTHAGTIRAILANVLAIPPNRFSRLDVPHASITRIEVMLSATGAYIPRLVFHNGSLKCSNPSSLRYNS